VEFTEKARIMDGARMNRALARLASEIVEENHGISDLVLVGIRRRGVPLANRIAWRASVRRLASSTSLYIATIFRR